MVLDNDFHALDPEQGWQNEYLANARPIRIGKFVFIGARAIILKGVTVGDRALIGAGAVVTQDVPADHIAAGNPARVFKKVPKTFIRIHKATALAVWADFSPRVRSVGERFYLLRVYRRQHER